MFFFTDFADDDEIMTYLAQADLSHIFQRTGGLDVQVDWNWYVLLKTHPCRRRKEKRKLLNHESV